MLKSFALSVFLAAAIAAFGQAHKDKDTVTNAVNHAGHWVSGHVNAPHKHLTKHHRRIHRVKKKDTVTHALNHAGKWVSHHVNAPHH
jgi:hypothetical protein